MLKALVIFVVHAELIVTILRMRDFHSHREQGSHSMSWGTACSVPRVSLQRVVGAEPQQAESDILVGEAREAVCPALIEESGCSIPC